MMMADITYNSMPIACPIANSLKLHIPSIFGNMAAATCYPISRQAMIRIFDILRLKISITWDDNIINYVPDVERIHGGKFKTPLNQGDDRNSTSCPQSAILSQDYSQSDATFEALRT